MLAIDELCLRYGSKVLFDKVSVNIGSRDRIGLVGSNGMGKSTLLKILMGMTEYDGGRIDKSKYLTIGYLPQDGIVARGKSLFKEVESAFDNVLILREHLQDANTKLHELESTSEEYYDLLDVIGGIEHRLEELEEHRLKSKIEKVLLGLGFKLTDMDRDVGEFSGGWQMRVALAKLLLREPTLLLLDEPTNHLDIKSLRWVERYLHNYEGAIMLISHDRAFLDGLCDKIFELSLGNLTVYSGNYSFYEEEKAHRKEVLEKAYVSQSKKIAKQERFIERFRSKASKASQVQSRIKQLEKIDRVELEQEEASMAFRFPEGRPSGQVVLELKNVSKAFDDLTVFKNVDLRIEKGDRVAVVGVNGAGKTTLAKVLAGEEKCTAGERIEGYQVAISFFAQHLADALNPNLNLVETVEKAAIHELKSKARSVLGSFLFSGDDAFKKVGVLSGGERCRLALACMLVQRANCLIMDEPTNHLDMKSQATLQAALKAFNGTLVIVSHYREFLDPLVTKVIEVSREDGVRVFIGNVTDYLTKVEAEEAIKNPEPGPKKVEKKSPSPQPQNKSKQKNPIAAKKELETLEKKLEEMEREKKELEEKMSDPEFFKQGIASKEAIDRHLYLEKKLEEAFGQWAELNEELNG